MKWETPVVVEINMSAEIGAYQGEEDGRAPDELRPSLALAEDIGDRPE
jgi:hypothetical protein